MNILIITNPVSGHKHGMNIATQLITNIENKGGHYEHIILNNSGHAVEILKSKNILHFERIVVIGGDGTMHEVINGLMHRPDGFKLPVALLPAGSGNSLLHDLEATELEIAMKIALSNNKTKIDIAEITHQDRSKNYGFNIIGCGFASIINQNAENFRWIGTIRYDLFSLFEIIKNKSYNVQLKVDHHIYNEKYAMILACNTIHTGKGMMAAPLAKLNDGLWDIIILRHCNRRTLIRLFKKIFSGKHVHDKNIIYLQTSQFELFGDSSEMLNIDGQVEGQSPCQVTILPRAIEIFTQ